MPPHRRAFLLRAAAVLAAAASGSAQTSPSDPTRELVEAIARVDASAGAELPDLLQQLGARGRSDLAPHSGALLDLAAQARCATTRAAAFAALAMADGSAERAYGAASASLVALADFLRGVPRIADPDVRAAMFPAVHGLVRALPERLQRAAQAPRSGRFVRVELPRQGTLSLAEVQVFAGKEDVARRGTARQSSVAHKGEARRAIDGNTSGDFARGSCTHTAEDEEQPWWEVDLGEAAPIDTIVIWNRTDGGHAKRLDGFTVAILDAERRPVFVAADHPAPAVRLDLPITGGGSDVQRAAILALPHACAGHEREAAATLAELVRDAELREAAVAALCATDLAVLAPEATATLAADLLQLVRALPLPSRHGALFDGSLELLRRLADHGAAGDELRAALAELTPIRARIAAGPEQACFDVRELVVTSGRQVELVFANRDAAPHNLLIVAPGALAEVARAAEEMAATPDGRTRNFIPKTEKVLHATALLPPGGEATLRFTAPEPGHYPFLCTEPGHWRAVSGVLKVVR